MKQILTLLLSLLIMPMCVSAQSEESNMLYKTGKKLYKAGQYEEAIPYLQKSDSLDKAQLDPDSKNYDRANWILLWCLEELVDIKKNQGDLDEARKLKQQALLIEKAMDLEDSSDVDSSLYSDVDSSLYNVASDYSNNVNFNPIQLTNEYKILQDVTMIAQNAISDNGDEKYAQMIDDLIDDYVNNAQEDIDNVNYLYDVARELYIVGAYTIAFRLDMRAMEIRKKLLGEGHPDFIRSLNCIAQDDDKMGYPLEAIKLGTQVMEVSKNLFSEESDIYAQSLDNMACFYASLGNYPEAIKLCSQGMIIRKKVLGEEHPDYAVSLNNLANFYAEIGNYSEAIELCTKAIGYQQKNRGKNNVVYGQSLSNLASYYSALGKYQEAIDLGSQAKKILSNNGSSTYQVDNNLALDYAHMGNYSKAYKTLEEIDARSALLGADNPISIQTKNNMAYIKFQAGKIKESTELYQQTYDRLEALVLKTFAYMTNKERSDFWNKYSTFFNVHQPLVAYHQPNDTLKSLAFNGQLLSKGLLLNAELEIQNLIEQQGNEQLKEMYYTLRQDHQKLDELYQLAPDERHMDADSLQKVIDNEERLLVESSKELGDYTQNLSIKWNDVQKSLKDNDIAIEFANFTDTTKQDVYIALILKKGMTSPELVKLDFADTDNTDYSSPTLYNKIWKPLENYLQGVQNVYFSPAGKFHTIGIEYLPNENNGIFAKQYNAYRLSSTRELALNHTVNPAKKASVYGGIIYNFDESDWQNVAVEEDAERAGESLTFLKGAKVEAEEITSILEDGSFDVQQGTDKTATEESFKKLSGSGIKILHIATHGFYEPETKKNSFANMLSAGEEHSQEDRSLSRSGLFFAGANTALNPEQRQLIPDGVDDGILTAKEISRLDFKGLDLVVLSACETGLGEVTGEGVFGLQRGFKKAGAQTIIMSLWKVNDKPAKEFMTEFYRNLMAGKSKREAFISAQDKNRQKYINPKMWAGFIMVDGEE